MHGQTNGGSHELGVIQFARVAKSFEANEGDQLDKAGQTLLQLVQNAAGVAEENSRRALSAAQNLLHQLRAAEDRIAELEAEVAAYQERADRAEQWLHRVYTEIEERFLRQAEGHRSTQRAVGRRA